MHQWEISRHTCNNDIFYSLQKGEGLQSTIEALPKFQGILNGIDDKVWNPATDSFLRNHYSAANLKGKQLIKNTLRRRLRMGYEGVDAKRPLVSEYIEKISLWDAAVFFTVNRYINVYKSEASILQLLLVDHWHPRCHCQFGILMWTRCDILLYRCVV